MKASVTQWRPHSSMSSLRFCSRPHRWIRMSTMHHDCWLREGEEHRNHNQTHSSLILSSPTSALVWGLQFLCEQMEIFQYWLLTQNFGRLLSFSSPPWPGCKCAAQIRMSKLTASYQGGLIAAGKARPTAIGLLQSIRLEETTGHQPFPLWPTS